MKKEKVCYVLPFFDLKTDTHYYHLYDFINEAAEDLDVFLIIEQKSDDDPARYFTNVRHIAWQRLPVPIKLLENIFLITKARMLGYKKFYIHYSFVSAITASLVARLTGGKTFYWSCGMMWLFGQDRFNQFMWWLTLHLVSHLVTGTHSMAQGYSEHYGISLAKTRIMPNWIESERFNRKYDRSEILKKLGLSDGRFVLFVHRLAKRKGAHYIVPIAEKLDRDVTFLVAGSGPYRDELEAEIAANGLKNIKLLGKVSNTAIPELMYLADVFLMPSEEEGFPRVLIEAMASGLPFVASDIGGVKEITPSLALPYVCQVGDIDCYVSSLRDILDKGKKPFATLVAESKKYDQTKVVKIFTSMFKENK